MDFIFRAAEKFLKDHKRLMRYRRIFAVLAAVVVFATTYELILPAITIDRQRAAETPGMEVGVAAEETAQMEEAEGEGGSAEADAQEETAAEAAAGTEAAQDESNDAEQGADYTEDASPSTDEDAGSADDSAAQDARAETGGENQVQTDSVLTEDGTTSESDADSGNRAVSTDETTTAADSDASATAQTVDAAVTREQAVEYPVTLTYEGEGYTITATFDETAAIPAGVSLDALEILPDMVYKDEDGNVLYDDYEVYLEKTVDTLEKDGRLEDSYVASARFFDISFLDQEGNYVTPTAPVVIAAQYKKALSADDTVSTTAVRFDAEKDKTEIYETKQDVKNGAIAEISFETKKTSIYGIAAAEALETKELTASGDTYEISLSYNQKAEIPEGAKLEAHELLPGTEEYEDCAAKSANTDENGETTSRFFDISIMADGAEFEPKAPVNVKITLKDTAPEKVAADKEITHFTNDGQVENIPQEVEESSDGGAEVSFQMDSFSTVEVPLLGAGSTPTYTISVGGTKEITGTKSYNGSNTWKSSDTTIATVSNSSTETETVTGVSAGNVTITHTYYINKKKTTTETFTVKVEPASDKVTDSEATAGTFAEDGFTVTVKDTGNLKKLSDYHVVVEDADNDHTEVDNFLKAYHIYLADQSGAAVDSSSLKNNGKNLNLQVTLTYDTLPEWFENAKDIKHYAQKNGTEQTIKSIEIDSVDRQISFIVHGFSEFVITANGTTTSGGIPVKTEMGSILENRAFDDANEWQILSGPYTNNSDNEKTVSQDGFVRVQKNILPGGTENEFYVYMSVDLAAQTGVTKTVVDKWLSTAKYVCGSSTHGSGNAVGTLGALQGEPKNTGNHMVHIVLTYGGVVIGETDVGCDVSNPSLYLALTDDPKRDKKQKKFILLMETLGSQSGTLDTQTVELNDEAYTALVERVEETTVTDTAVSNIEVTEIIDGTRFKQVSVISVDGTFDTTQGKWLVVQGTPTGTTTETTGTDSNSVTTVWRENVAELLYKVTLNTTTSDFKSDKGEYFVGSQPATATYKYGNSNGSINFPNVSVKGLLYDVKVLKVDDEGKNLPGATFELTGSDGNTIHGNYSLTGTTNSDGEILTFKDLPWGTYSIKETEAPDGYIVENTSNPRAVTLCWTTAKDKLTDSTIANNHKMYKDWETDNKFVNREIRIAIKKVDDQGDILTASPQAEFTLTNTDDSSKSYTAAVSASGQDRGYAVLTKVPVGTYKLTETTAPTGYKKIAPATVVVGMDGTISVGNSSDGLVTETSALILTADNGETYSYSAIQVENKKSSVKVVIRKTDEKGYYGENGTDTAFLSGAAFTLTKGDGTALSGITLQPSDENGYVTTAQGIELDAGTYQLTETTAPEGYNSVSGPITITVNESEQNRVTAQHGVTSYDVVLDSENNIYTVYIENNPGVELPETGGTGFLSPQTLCGIMAMAFVLATAVMYSFSMRRGERRYK